MKLKIIGVYSPGNLTKERLHLKAIEDIEISNYALFDQTFNAAGKISGIGKHIFKFPTQAIKKDDHIILYTRVGKNSTQLREDKKSNNYFIYWGRESTVWNANDKDICTLMELHDTQIIKVNTD